MILGVWWILCLGVVVQLLAAYYWLLIFVTVVLRDCFFNVCAVPLCSALKIDNAAQKCSGFPEANTKWLLSYTSIEVCRGTKGETQNRIPAKMIANKARH